MNTRKLFALFMVLALTGGALAAQQQNTYHCDKTGSYGDSGYDANCDPLEAQSVTAIQQHSVFVEIVVEDDDINNDSAPNQIHEFAAVVGLVKKCKAKINNPDEEASQFDNAVLWFNDQFLFGEKNVTVPDASDGYENETGGLGTNEETPGNHTDGNGNVEAIGFYKRTGMDQARWGGCYIPDGFVHAIGSDDPYGSGAGAAGDAADEYDGNLTAAGVPNDNIDYVKQLIGLDNTCQGCIFEYQSTFFVTDPNGHTWMVDKLVYPGSFNGNLFTEGADNGDGNNCASGNGEVNQSDPRDAYPHHSRCEDNNPSGSDEDNAENHCTDGSSEASYEENGECGADTGKSETSTLTAVEPIYTVHTQVNPTTLEGFADKQTWQYADGTDRTGMPYADDQTDGNYDYCKNAGSADIACAVEYDFMITVDFAAFDNTDVSAQEGSLEDEVKDDAVHHGAGGDDNSDSAEDGNSHPHNPEAAQSDPGHKHNALNLDLFFYKQAPHFVTQNPYWDAHGAPPTVTQDCSQVLNYSPGATASEETAQEEAVENRSPIVCDVDADDGYHMHDGSQTVRPTN